MKKYQKRVLFSSEKNLKQRDESHCKECNCKRGELHVAGCRMEECPQCRRSVVTCGCGRLSPQDSAEIVQALYDQIEDLETGLADLEATPPPAGAGPSLLQHAVMQYVFHVAPDTVKNEITRAFHMRFPGLTPILQDDQGRGYYTAEQLAKALGISIDEVQERINAMITAGHPVEVAEGKELHKVH